MADNRISSVFGAYAEQLQVFVDARLDKFRKTWFPAYFDWGVPAATLSYTTVIGRQRIEAAASVVDHGAKAPRRSRTYLEKLAGEVSAIKVARQMKEADYYQFLAVQSMRVAEDIKKTQIMKFIWDDLAYCGNAVMDRLDIMVCQALSTGLISINTSTNPDGIAPGDIDLLMPAANAVHCAVTWETAHLATMTPITDIETTVAAAEIKGIKFEKILMPIVLYRLFSKCTEVLNLMKGWQQVEAGTIKPSLAKINEYLTENQLPIIEVVDIVKSIETDGIPATYRPWDQANITFVPTGKLGVIHNTLTVEQIRPVTGVSYATFNNCLLSKWAQNDPFAEYTQGELKAFPGVEAIDSIYIMETDATS